MDNSSLIWQFIPFVKWVLFSHYYINPLHKKHLNFKIRPLEKNPSLSSIAKVAENVAGLWRKIILSTSFLGVVSIITDEVF